jgi:hypothetical protein
VNTTPQSVSVVTDISANIFALLVLLLIIALAARETSSTKAVAPATIDVDMELAGVERAPLNSEALVDLFYERRNAATSTRIDLKRNAIDVVSGGAQERFGSLEDASPRLRQLGTAFNRMPASIYVFDHHFYRGLTDSLKAMSWPWLEVSVPQALRDTDPGASDQGWSAGFSELIARQSGPAQFRHELAQLLQASSTPSDRRSGGGAQQVTSMRSPMDGIMAALRRWKREGINVIAVFCGIAFIVWVERRSRRPSHNH